VPAGPELERLAAAFTAKYDDDWRVRAEGDQFVDRHGVGADVYRVHPRTVHAFAKQPYSQTRWTF
jgi:hypothetical protein